jgi:hypothetical protein
MWIFGNAHTIFGNAHTITEASSAGQYWAIFLLPSDLASSMPTAYLTPFPCCHVIILIQE